MPEVRSHRLTWRERMDYYKRRLAAYRARRGGGTPTRATMRRWVRKLQAMEEER